MSMWDFFEANPFKFYAILVWSGFVFITLFACIDEWRKENK